MARPSDRKTDLELKRLELLHNEQAKVRKRISKETRVKKSGYHLPGEIAHKKNMAVFMKIGMPGVSFSEIANRIGETKGTVRTWFRDDPDVKEFYEFVLSHLKEAAIQLNETYIIEANETMAMLMRFGSEKYMFEAAKDFLDRNIPKVTKQEIEAQNKKSHSWSDREALVSDIRDLSPEQQEQAIEALEKFEELLSTTASGEITSESEIEEEAFEEEVEDGE